MPVVILTSEADSAVLPAAFRRRQGRTPADGADGRWNFVCFAALRTVSKRAAGSFSGREQNREAAARPISLSTEIVPPCASTNSFEMVSPQPAALHLGSRDAEIALEDAFVVTRVDAAPEVLDVDLDRLFRCTAPMMMRDRSGEWWMAFDSRLVMTQAIFSLSTKSFEIFSG